MKKAFISMLILLVFLLGNISGIKLTQSYIMKIIDEDRQKIRDRQYARLRRGYGHYGR